MHFNDFNIGDYVSFKKTFKNKDFNKFRSLSGDDNLLHYDKKYSASTVFKKPIVPVHLTIAPLSMIAGMIFPGEPSLYLGHTIKATLPIFYNQSISYSAKIIDINKVMKILRIKVLAYRGSEMVIEAELNVKTTEEKWDNINAKKIKNTNEKKWALVTGAKGSIGSSVVKKLIQDGYSILYNDRVLGLHRNKIEKYIKDNNSKIKFISADLSSSQGHKIIIDYIKNKNIEVDVFVHAASAPIDAHLMDLVEVNYVAFKSIVNALIPNMLLRQKGRIIFIGSSSIFNINSQLEDYTAVKSMTTNFAALLDKKYKKHGVRTQVLLPGFVDTKFSYEIRGNSPALLPEEVASCISNMLINSGPNIEILDIGINKSGEIIFLDNNDSLNKIDTILNKKTIDHKVYSSIENKGFNIREEIISIIMKELELLEIKDLNNGALDYTVGWDSLNHIKIILAIENYFSIKFTSEHFEKLTSLDDIVNSVNTILTDIKC